MCGIIGYTGTLPVKDILIDGLKKLEYRGYDSAGIALSTNDHKIKLYKKAGKVQELETLVRELENSSTCGIGHTRWATHGGVSDFNSHPHMCGKVALIHNGIIENYHALIEQFHLEGTLNSETDSEVACAVINQLYDGNPTETITKAVAQFEGSFAFCILFSDFPNHFFCVRNVSPMVAAISPTGTLVASDLTALIAHTNEYFVIPEHHIVILNETKIEIVDFDNVPFTPKFQTVTWNIEDAKKGGYEYYMLKEIMEQPEKLSATISARLVNQLPDLSIVDHITDEDLMDFNKIQVIACGTAMYAGMVFKSMIESIIQIPITVSIASEYRYDKPIVDDKTLIVVISQSGETIDTLEALRLSKTYGAKSIAVVNSKGSTIARESDHIMYMYTGPEIAVASTKAYTAQVMTLAMLGCKIALVRKRFSKDEAIQFMKELTRVPELLTQVLQNQDTIIEVADYLKKCTSTFFIGRGIDYSLAMEGSLKLKEISYIHAEAYAAGELKHGTIALIEKDVPVIAIATQETIYSKTISNIEEVKARGAYVILITKESALVNAETYDIHLTVPDIDDRFTSFLVAGIVQLIAYHTSYKKGLDVDMPRNLAKSVTVE